MSNYFIGNPHCIQKVTKENGQECIFPRVYDIVRVAEGGEISFWEIDNEGNVSEILGVSEDYEKFSKDPPRVAAIAIRHLDKSHPIFRWERVKALMEYEKHIGDGTCSWHFRSYDDEKVTKKIEEKLNK